MKQNKAITLISLVVTIIVLIILAAVSINLLLGQNGIMTKARDARNNYALAANEEDVQLKNLGSKMDSLASGTISDGQSIVHPTSMTISAEGNATSIYVGNTLKLALNTIPNKITDTITWSSSDISKASIDNTGLVTGIAVGSTTITATAKDSNNVIQKTATYEITIDSANTASTTNDLQVGDTINYRDKNGVNRPCIVLYDSSSSYGVQIITRDSVETVSIGGTTKEEARTSWNDAINTLHQKAQNYLNPDFAVSARCAGSNPSNPTSETTSYHNKTYNNGPATFSFRDQEGDWKDVDYNYTSDNNVLKNLLVPTETTSFFYASREISGGTDKVNLSMHRYAANDVGINAYVYARLYSYGQTNCKIQKDGFRPVFKLKDNLPVSNGSEYGTMYTL